MILFLVYWVWHHASGLTEAVDISFTEWENERIIKNESSSIITTSSILGAICYTINDLIDFAVDDARPKNLEIISLHKIFIYF